MISQENVSLSRLFTEIIRTTLQPCGIAAGVMQRSTSLRWTGWFRSHHRIPRATPRLASFSMSTFSIGKIVTSSRSCGMGPETDPYTTYLTTWGNLVVRLPAVTGPPEPYDLHETDIPLKGAAIFVDEELGRCRKSDGRDW